jgi:hypothetical protein
MIEHLFHNNCGEMTALIALLGALPFLGPTIRRWWKARSAKQCTHNHNHGATK